MLLSTLQSPAPWPTLNRNRSFQGLYVDMVVRTKQNRFSLYPVGVFIVLLCLSAISCERSAVRSAESDNSYHIGINSNVKAAPVLVAEEKDFFRKEGLSVRVSRERSALHLLEGLYSGTYDFVCVPSFLVARDFLAGKQFRILAVLNRNQSRYLLMNPDRAENPADLAGHRIGINPDSAAEFVLMRFLVLNGLDPESIAIRYFGEDTLPEMLASGAVSAILTWPPYVAEARSLMNGNILAINAQMGVDVYWLLVAREDSPRETQHDIGRLFRALDHSYDLIFGDPGEAKALVRRTLMTSSAQIDEEWKDFIFMLEMPQSFLLVIEQQCEWIARKSNLSFDAASLFSRIEYQPLEAVYPERVSIIR